MMSGLAEGGRCTEPRRLLSPWPQVAPVGDRLLLFFSDLRTPHEVLPACAPRRACTLWYVERDGGSVESK